MIGGAAKRLVARTGLTEGQAYTAAILLVVAALLLSSLTGLTGRIAEVGAAPQEPAPTTTTTSPPAPPAVDLAPPSTAYDPAPFAPPATTEVPPAPTTTAPPSAPLPEAGPEPEEPPCPAATLVSGARDTVQALDGVLGGVVPDATIVSALAIVTGCSQTDPAILIVASLIELGQSLPDLGLGFIELPVLPFLELPVAVIDLLQPLRAVLDPVCNTAATLAVITSQVGPYYQAPIDAVFSVSLFYILATCGQIQAPTA